LSRYAGLGRRVADHLHGSSVPGELEGLGCAVVSGVQLKRCDWHVLREVEAVSVLRKGEDEVTVGRERRHRTPPESPVGPRHLCQADWSVMRGRPVGLCPVDVVGEEIRLLTSTRRIVIRLTARVGTRTEVDGDVQRHVVTADAGRRVDHSDPLSSNLTSHDLTSHDRDARGVK